MSEKSDFKLWILPAGEYRSRSEYFFAQWCDKWRIPFTYEPEGIQLPDGVRILPDFFLTESNIFVEVKPAIFKGELWKFDRLMNALQTSKDDQPPIDMPLGWVVQICNQQPVACDLYDQCGMDDSSVFFNRETNGFCTCYQCGRPYIIPVGSYTCHHCGHYEGGHLDFGSNYYPERLAKSIAWHKAQTQSDKIAAWEAKRVEAEKEALRDQPF